MKTLAEFKRQPVGQKFDFKAAFTNGATMERELLQKQTNALGLSGIRPGREKEASWIYFDGELKRFSIDNWLIFTTQETTQETINKFLNAENFNSFLEVPFFLAYRRIEDRPQPTPKKTSEEVEQDKAEFMAEMMGGVR